jgi:sec-independent protein translocase protein TatA
MEVSPMGALSPWHIILIALVALLLFGPNKLPELGRGFGKMFREFKDATNGSSPDESAPRKEVGPSASESSQDSKAPDSAQTHPKS